MIFTSPTDGPILPVSLVITQNINISYAAASYGFMLIFYLVF